MSQWGPNTPNPGDVPPGTPGAFTAPPPPPPRPGYQGAGPYANAPTYQGAPPTNGLAIAALILTFVFAPAGLVLGIVAKNQIKQTGEGGDGLATAAIVVSAVFIVISIFAIIAVIAAISRVNNGFPNSGAILGW